MGNVTLPTPVFLAGGALCLVAGYLVGSLSGPGTGERTTATVVSFEGASSKLCLQGDATKGQDGAGSDGVLCGTWRHNPSSTTPAKGDHFRFVSVATSGESGGKKQSQVVIYGDVSGG